jgi:hypothetical protein
MNQSVVSIVFAICLHGQDRHGMDLYRFTQPNEFVVFPSKSDFLHFTTIIIGAWVIR